MRLPVLKNNGSSVTPASRRCMDAVAPASRRCLSAHLIPSKRVSTNTESFESRHDQNRAHKGACRQAIWLLSVLTLTAGCQSTNHFKANDLITVEPATTFITVADTTTKPSTEQSSPATTPAESAGTKKRYTAPRAQFQGIDFITSAISTATISRTNTGKEAAEAGISPGSTITGAPGLGAPQARTVEAIVSQPGLQRGFPIGFGLMPSQNIFTRTFNPLTGPNSACSALIGAGFFANPQTCQTQLRR